ncbi:MAG: hypothetical protein U0350_14105 [Caldilineaceae bacterium]
MKLRLFSYWLVFVMATSLLMLLLLTGQWFGHQKADSPQQFHFVIKVTQANRTQPRLAAPLEDQVVAASPVEIPAPPTPAADRYKTRNEFPADRSQPLPLYLVDTTTGQEIRLGDDSGEALYEQARNERYLLWWFGCRPKCPTWRNGLHAYVFATGEDRFVAADAGGSRPKLYSDWVAYPTFYGGPKQAKLTLVNLATQEIITFTTEVFDRLGDSDHLAIGERLAAWVTAPHAQSSTEITPATLRIYDLAAHPITTLVLDQPSTPMLTTDSMYSLAANETVVTWGREYGYDVVTGSFFTFTLTTRPWTAWGGEVVYISPVEEKDRMLHWYIQTKDATKYYLQAPLIDATPSAAPCVEGQNLVQNGDLEDSAAHNVWQQNGSPSDLIVNELPPNPPQAGQWAIRLGRYSNSQQTIQQTVNLPSNVKHITLAFDVRAQQLGHLGRRPVTDGPDRPSHQPVDSHHAGAVDQSSTRQRWLDSLASGHSRLAGHRYTVATRLPGYHRLGLPNGLYYRQHPFYHILPVTKRNPLC